MQHQWWINEWMHEYEVLVDWYRQEGTEICEVKVFPVPIGPQHGKHGLASDRNRACAWGLCSKLNSSIFWVITRRKMVWNRRFGATYLSLKERSFSPAEQLWARTVPVSGMCSEGSSRFLRNVGKLPTWPHSSTILADDSDLQNSVSCSVYVRSASRTMSFVSCM